MKDGVSDMEQPTYQIGTIEKGKFVIMQNYQSFATFWIKNNGGLTVSYNLVYKTLDVQEKIMLNIQIDKFIEAEDKANC